VTFAPLPRHRRPAVVALLFNAAVWGCSWWPLRELQTAGLHPLWSTALVYTLSVVVLLMAARRALRQLLDWPVLGWLFLAAGLTNVGFNWAVTVGDVVRVVLLFYLMPAWSVLLAWWLLDERPGRGALLRVALALAGVALVIGVPDAGRGAAGLALADGLALLGGFSFALTNALLRKFAHAPAGARALAMFGGGAGLATALALALGPVAGVPLPPAPAAGWLLMGGGLCLAFLAGNLALQYGAARLSAHTTALVMVTEVAFAGLSAVALGAAELSPRVLAGGALIVLAAVLASLGPDGSH
jgi:drug/metabolite transporter (DMT)-like permease